MGLLVEKNLLILWIITVTYVFSYTCVYFAVASTFNAASQISCQNSHLHASETFADHSGNSVKGDESM